MSWHIDCVVIGAGVVGLAVARACALVGWETVVLERETAFGTATSSRNSEVIHAGIYYPAGSLKARLCVRGRKLLYAYCRDHHVDHRRCGKLIVATDDGQVDTLRVIGHHAAANGVDDLVWLEGAAARRLEPDLACVAAWHSPSTGIVDSHGLILSLLGELESAGGVLALQAPVVGGSMKGGDGTIMLEVGGDVGEVISARHVVNCAGLDAVTVAAAIDGMSPACVPAMRLAKGNYYALAGKTPFSHLVYPIPEPGGLGVHLTLDLAGRARFGPDVEWVESVDYSVDPARADGFYAAVRRYWPDLPDGALHADYAGIRPKLAGGDGDFVIQDARTHGIDGLVNLFGIESPGLTASLAIAEEVVARLQHDVM